MIHTIANTRTPWIQSITFDFSVACAATVVVFISFNQFEYTEKAVKTGLGR